MNYKILVTGANGQLGYELKKILSLDSSYELYFTDADTLDITDSNSVNDFFKNLKIDFI